MTEFFVVYLVGRKFFAFDEKIFLMVMDVGACPERDKDVSGGVKMAEEISMARRSETVVEERKTEQAHLPVAAMEPAAKELSREQLIEFYRLMYLSRRTDDPEISL